MFIRDYFRKFSLAALFAEDNLNNRMQPCRSEASFYWENIDPVMGMNVGKVCFCLRHFMTHLMQSVLTVVRTGHKIHLVSISMPSLDQVLR